MAEKMDIPKIFRSDDANPQLVASIHPDVDSPFRQLQTVEEENTTPQNIPRAPRTSPVLPIDESTTSRLSNSFKSELMKACSTSFSEKSNLLHMERTEAPSYFHVESSPSVFENMSRYLDCSTPMDLDHSLSHSSFGVHSKSPYSEKESLIAHRDSDVSDISLSDSLTMLSDDDTADLDKQDGYKSDSENAKCWKMYNSPRKPKSSVGTFLKWRENKKVHKKLTSSADNIYNPYKREKDDRDSEFLNTI